MKPYPFKLNLLPPASSADSFCFAFTVGICTIVTSNTSRKPVLIKSSWNGKQVATADEMYLDGHDCEPRMHLMFSWKCSPLMRTTFVSAAVNCGCDTNSTAFVTI